VTCESIRESAAVSLLTREPLDREVRAHVVDCPGCQEEVARLAELPPLLDEAEDAVSAADSAPPPALLERLLAAAAEQRRARRRGVRATLLAAAAALLLVLIPVGAWSLAHRDTVVPSFHGSATDAASGVTAAVDLRPAEGGSTLALSISGVPAGTLCTVVVQTDHGGRQTAATWSVGYRGTAHVTGTVAASVTDVRTVDVVDEGTGRVLVEVPGP